MGYACPVCGVPTPDAEHLANHLAFTALLGDADHERFLDDRVPDWAEQGPETLGEAVVEYAAGTEDPRVFEEAPGSDHDHPDTREVSGRAGGLDDEAADVLREARELTARMHEEREE